ENQQGHLWSRQLGLYLGIDQGLLRYFTPTGELVPTPEETAEQETKRDEKEARKSERVAAKVRELNIDPDTI
ncbi:MAG: Uma2 family endonuclease, partial [Dolichospermum sp.]